MSNTITITGNVGDDAELAFSHNGRAYLRFSLADNESRKLDNGEWETVSTTWFNVTAFGPTAEAFADSIKKGSRVRVTGRVKLRDYEARDGSKGKSLDVAADALGLESPRGERRQQQSSGSKAADPWASRQQSSFNDQYVPF